MSNRETVRTFMAWYKEQKVFTWAQIMRAFPNSSTVVLSTLLDNIIDLGWVKKVSCCTWETQI